MKPGNPVRNTSRFTAPQCRAGRLGRRVPSVLLIRHGQASYASADYDVLSEAGVRQARAVHDALTAGARPPTVLVSGALERQRDTAAPWIERGASLRIDPRWNEYDAADVLGAHSCADASLERPVDAGGRPVSSRDFQALLDAALGAWIEAGEAGPARETWPAFRDRCVAALEDVMRGLGSGESAFVFTSGGVIAALAAYVLDLPPATLVSFNHVTVNGGVTKLVGGRRGVSLISFNEHLHLERADLITYR